MAQIVNMSDAASIGLHTLILMASDPGRMMSARELADALQVSEAHLAKVLQRLVREGLVTSQRGPGGGFLLKGEPAEVTLLTVYEAIDGKLDTDRCMLGVPVCSGDGCVFGSLTSEIHHRIRDQLSQTTLTDLQGTLAPLL